ncbi:MAG: FAD-dependent oxidoreductase [Planctomycetota bacterium]
MTDDKHQGADIGEQHDVLILGAGVAGLSAGYELAKAGYQVTVVEKLPFVGGLATSFQEGPYTYDLGPHRFYTKNPALIAHMEEILPDDLFYPIRKSRIYMRNRFFDYPLRLGNILKSLPPWTLAKAFSDYLFEQVKGKFKPPQDRNFEEYIRSRFGKTLYEMFFGMYTAKAWGIPPTEISADWASQRISLLNLWDTVVQTVKSQFFKGKNEPRTYASQFFYPKHGGFGRICETYRSYIESKGGQVLCGADLKSIEYDEKRLTKAVVEHEGKTLVFEPERIVNTIPVTSLPRFFQPAIPVDVSEAISRLWYKAIVFSYLVIKRPQLTDDHWIYLPEPKLISHRISEMKNFSPNCAPPDETIICMEITTNFESEIWKMNAEEAAKITAQDLVRIGLIDSPDEVVTAFIQKRKHAYPMYDLIYKENLERLLEYLDRFENLMTTGRQGLFKYNNSDHSIEMGLAVAAEIIGADREGRGIAQDHRTVATEKEYFG